MIRAVAIGVVHMHINEVALYMSEQPDFELVAFADVNAGSEELEPFRYTRKWNCQKAVALLVVTKRLNKYIFKSLKSYITQKLSKFKGKIMLFEC